MAFAAARGVTVLVPGLPPGVRRWSEGDSIDWEAPVVWTVPDVLTRQECDALVARIEAHNPEQASVQTARGVEVRTEIRNNDRVILDDLELAERLYQRVLHSVPAQLCGERGPVGANERLRFYRYRPGQRFGPHFDGSFLRNPREESLLTLIVYLNEGFGGGETRFLDYRVDVVPRAGLALLFQHHVLHEGAAVSSGVKYAVRSDVMYRAGGSRE